MKLVEGYDHQPGVHCGAAALRNVSQYYGWQYDEASCFGIGGGAAFVRYQQPGEPWSTFRASPLWLERAFFERLGVSHTVSDGEDFETAWSTVTGAVDTDDPAVLFLDPEPLPYLPADGGHLPPHVAVLIGYDGDAVVLSDAAAADRQSISRATLRRAWRSEGVVPLDHESLIVTRTRRTIEGNDAAAAGLRQAARYMLDPLSIQRDARGPGSEGILALRSFADRLGSWAELSDPRAPVNAALRSIDGHSDGTAYRALFAESLATLGQRTGLPTELADRTERVARQWRTVGDLLGDVVAEADPSPARFEEAASVVADIADREESIFVDLSAELGRVVE